MAPADREPRLAVLDGWRAISLLCVLTCHLVPLGPHALQGNAMIGTLGMALFFSLSGFLITRFSLASDNALGFIVRRVARVVPLAWLVIVVAFPWFGASAEQYAANALFIANLIPGTLLDAGVHLWSLCIEFQFYVGAALILAAVGRRGLSLIPILCVAVTAHRIRLGAPLSIDTPLRIDEILAGGTVALVYSGVLGARARRLLGTTSPFVLLALLFASSHPLGGVLGYLRPYVAALLLGSVLTRPDARVKRLLGHPILGYLAEVSYAVYVIHHFLIFTWLGSGGTWVKYAKRPLLLGTTVVLAHLSTFYFEKPCITVGKRLARRLARSDAERELTAIDR